MREIGRRVLAWDFRSPGDWLVNSGATSSFKANSAEGVDSSSTFPASSSPSKPALGPTPELAQLSEPTSRNPPQLLLVEDDRATSKALQKILIHHGCQVLLASTLAEAWPLIATNPDVLILDLMLPDGDGMTLLKRIREEHRSIRVVVTTGSNDPTRLSAVRHLDPEYLLFKPVELIQLLQALGIVH